MPHHDHHPDTPRNRGDHDAPHLSPATPGEDIRTIMLNRISWGAVAAGVVVSLVAQLILNMIGIGVGAATLDPTAGAAGNPAATTFSLGAAIWWAASGILAAFAGGYASGRLSGRPKAGTTAWHGLTTWALTTLVVFYLLTSTVSGMVSGAYSAASGALGGMGSAVTQTAQAAAPGLTQGADPFAQIEGQIRSATGGTDPAALRDAAVAAVRAAVTGDEAQAQDARERAAQAISQAQGIPVEEARTRVTQYEQQYRQTLEETRRQAVAAADVAAAAVAQGALVGALALLLGAVAGWFGGRAGAVRPTLTDTGLGLGIGAERTVA